MRGVHVKLLCVAEAERTRGKPWSRRGVRTCRERGGSVGCGVAELVAYCSRFMTLRPGHFTACDEMRLGIAGLGEQRQRSAPGTRS